MSTVYCKNCGKNIDALAVICIHCGVATGVGVSNVKPDRNDLLSIIAMVLGGLGLLIPLTAIAGIVVAIIAKSKSELKWSYGLAVSVGCLLIGLFLYI